jgi:hypothetical protein
VKAWVQRFNKKNRRFGDITDAGFFFELQISSGVNGDEANVSGRGRGLFM